MRKQMKILSITAQKPHSTGSGVYLMEMVENWSESGCIQAVVAGIYKEDRVELPEGTSFYPVEYHSPTLPFAITGMSDEMPYESTRYSDMTEGMTEQFADRFRQVTDQAVKELQPDLIVCHHLYLLTALVRDWYPDRKIIAFSHGSDLRQIRKNPLKRDYIKSRIARLDAVMALHEAHKKEIGELFGIEEDRIHVMGIGYNQDIFYRKKGGNPGDKSCRQIAFAGKVTEKKGIFSLLDALEQLPYAPDEIVVKIAGGHGPEKEYTEIKRRAKACRYRVEFPGILPQTDLAEMFRQSDLFVLPSFYEGLPLVVLEAMACGCKVVCSDIPGVAQWLLAHVPGCGAKFVPLPKMQNTDEPCAEELPAFGRRLKDAIVEELEREETEPPETEQVSWRGISSKILQITAEVEK